jgi:hypothetical protein
MINMPLRLGKTDDCCGGWPLWGTPGNTSQDKIQLIFVIISAVCVPLMFNISISTKILFNYKTLT